MADANAHAPLVASQALLALVQSSLAVYVRGFRHRCIHFAPLHRHAVMEVVLHLTGAGEEWLEDGIPVPFTAGSVSLHPPGLMHAQRMRRPGDDICVHVAVPAPLPPELRSSMLAIPARDLLLRQQFLELTQVSYGSELDVAMRNHLIRAVLARLVVLAQAHAGPADPVLHAQQYLREHFQDMVSLHEVAQSVGLGLDHLRHRFKRQTGTTLLEYLTALRISCARDLLEHSSLPVAQIARQCGYASHRHLGVLFRRVCGCTPRDYRRDLT